MRPRYLRAGQRLFLSYLVLIAIVVAALTVAAEFALRRPLTDAAAADLRHELLLARDLYSQRADLAPDSLADYLGSLTSHRVSIVAADGTVIGDSDLDGDDLAGLENHSNRPEILAARQGRIGFAVRPSASIGARLLYAAAPAARDNVIRVAVPLREIDATVSRIRRGIVGVGFAALAIAALFSLGFSVAVTQPLRRASSAARAMAAGDLSRRIRAPHGDELGELADALNGLAEELQGRLGQLEGERAEVQALFDAMSEGVLALGPDGAVRRLNPAANEIFSLAGNSVGLRPEQVARGSEFLKIVGRALQGSTVLPTELSIADRHLLVTAQPLPNGGAVLVFLDISELRRLEGVRRDFVANASHELKTPLTAIRGYSETLLDEDISPELRRHFTVTVNENAERLQEIVDDLLDLSRLESGGWRARPEAIHLDDVAREAWKFCEEEAGERRISFSVNTESECDVVLADRSALDRIFSNLFSNAIHYTPDGGQVEVVARCVDANAPAASRFARIAVRDTGSGIPAAQLPRIFERFYRVDASRARSDGGTGLGLAIVRHLVEAHGGEVTAESALGGGTIISFTLPLANLAEPTS